MKRFYTKLIPHISIRDTKVHDVKPAELLKLENKVKKLEEEKNEDMEWVRKFRGKYGDNVLEDI